jgi:hypothetical protein
MTAMEPLLMAVRQPTSLKVGSPMNFTALAKNCVATPKVRSKLRSTALHSGDSFRAVWVPRN